MKDATQPRQQAPLNRMSQNEFDFINKIQLIFTFKFVVKRPLVEAVWMSRDFLQFNLIYFLNVIYFFI